mgnify:CR=1 FL=1
MIVYRMSNKRFHPINFHKPSSLFLRLLQSNKNRIPLSLSHIEVFQLLFPDRGLVFFQCLGFQFGVKRKGIVKKHFKKPIDGKVKSFPSFFTGQSPLPEWQTK